MSNSATPSAFRAWLRAELARRCAHNSSYSLRAFAQSLAVDHATLSQLIRGRRELTPETIARLGDALGLSPAAVDAFVADARVSRAGAPQLTAAADIAAIGGDPSHHALLALLATEDFEPDARFIARVLDLSVDDVQVALQRLARVGLLEMRAEGWVDVLGLGSLEAGAFEFAVWQHALARLDATQSGGAARTSAASSATRTLNSREHDALRVEHAGRIASDPRSGDDRPTSNASSESAASNDPRSDGRAQTGGPGALPAPVASSDARSGGRAQLGGVGTAPALGASSELPSTDGIQSGLASAADAQSSAPRPVKRFQILARNSEAVASFYGRLFGWTTDAQNALGYRQISTGGLDGGIWPVPPGAPAFVQLFIEVPDIAATCSRAVESGAAVLMPPQLLPGGDEMAVLRDPEGITFGVFRGR